ncbi:hypothetical protein OH77DRAFT_1004595 [Trametes cingulata]|nr:hypothetical protein OH77DRAFT_1004595 [Trametes cingulata]
MVLQAIVVATTNMTDPYIPLRTRIRNASLILSPPSSRGPRFRNSGRHEARTMQEGGWSAAALACPTPPSVVDGLRIQCRCRTKFRVLYAFLPSARRAEMTRGDRDDEVTPGGFPVPAHAHFPYAREEAGVSGRDRLSTAAFAWVHRPIAWSD